jgi:hypothetical protein
MPKHHVTVTLETSPEEKIKLGPFKTENDATKAKDKLNQAQGKKIVDAQTESP